MNELGHQPRVRQALGPGIADAILPQHEFANPGQRIGLHQSEYAVVAELIASEIQRSGQRHDRCGGQSFDPGHADAVLAQVEFAVPFQHPAEEFRSRERLHPGIADAVGVDSQAVQLGEGRTFGEPAQALVADVVAGNIQRAELADVFRLREGTHPGATDRAIVIEIERFQPGERRRVRQHLHAAVADAVEAEIERFELTQIRRPEQQVHAAVAEVVSAQVEFADMRECRALGQLVDPLGGIQELHAPHGRVLKQSLTRFAEVFGFDRNGVQESPTEFATRKQAVQLFRPLGLPAQQQFILPPHQRAALRVVVVDAGQRELNPDEVGPGDVVGLRRFVQIVGVNESGAILRECGEDRLQERMLFGRRRHRDTSESRTAGQKLSHSIPAPPSIAEADTEAFAEDGLHVRGDVEAAAIEFAKRGQVRRFRERPEPVATEERVAGKVEPIEAG